jgi:peptidoglycan/xylan/chitin deacetylase (PgdA/CDA1 family)
MVLSIFLGVTFLNQQSAIGQTEIMRWQDGKKAAVALTFDDGIVTQFRIAAPMLRDRGLGASFYIVTGSIAGSKYAPKFIGRSIEEIVQESGRIPTDQGNFLERCSALRHFDHPVADGTAGDIFDFFKKGEVEKSYALVDHIFEQYRKGHFKPPPSLDGTSDKYKPLSWEEIKLLAAEGFEFAAHTITHPDLLILDDANLQYEVEKSKEELEIHLGSKHTFSYVNPGTEKYKKEYVQKRFYSIRDIMPEDEDYLQFVRGGTPKDYLTAWITGDTEYSMWRVAPRTGTSVAEMKGWVETVLKTEGCLLFVFHGIEGVGSFAKPKEEFAELFDFLRQNQDQVWVPTFQEIQKYQRERMKGSVATTIRPASLRVKLAHTLDPTVYDLPLTLRTYVPPEWQTAQFEQGPKKQDLAVKRDAVGSFVIYRATPNYAEITLSWTK